MTKSILHKILLIIFWLSACGLGITKALQWPILELILTPILPLTLVALYHFLNGKDQTIYFAFSFCLLGDIMILSENTNYFVSGLTAYWGASILFSFSLYRELNISMREAVNKTKMRIPFLIYGVYFILLMYFIQPYFGEVFIPTLIYALSLSFTCAFGFVVYFNRKSNPSLYFCLGLFFISIGASIIGLNRYLFDYIPLRFFETLFYAPSLFFIFLYFKTKKTSDY